MKGARWTLLGFAINRVLLFLSTAVLAHWLPPSSFGLLAAATTISSAVLVFSDMGLAGTLVTRADSGRRVEAVVFGCYLLLAPALGLLVLACGVVLWLTTHVAFAALLMAVAGVLVISGPSWFLNTLLRKQLLFFQQFVATTAQAGVQFALTLLLAAHGAGIWSILMGQAAGVVVLTALQLRSGARVPRPAFSREEARSAVRNGRGFFLQSFFAFLTLNVDKLVALALTGSRGLGLYAMSYRLAEVPYVAVVNPVSDVTFVRFAQGRNAGEDVFRPFLRSHRVLTACTAPISTVFLSSSASLLLVVYGPAWGDAAAPLAVLGAWSLLRGPQSGLGWLLNSMGMAGLMGRFAGWALVAVTPVLVLGALVWGVTGVALALCLEVLLSYGYMLHLVRSRLGWPVGPVLRVLLGAVVSAAACTGALLLLDAYGPALAPVVRLAAGVVGAGLTQLAATWWLDRPLLRSGLRALRRTAAPVPAEPPGRALLVAEGSAR